MIWELLKEYTRYDLVKRKNMVVCWVKTYIDELVEEKMGSSIQVDQDDFKAVVEVLKNR